MEGFKRELTDNILSFWTSEMIDTENGGFYGVIDGNNILSPQANKGAILNARILWTFSSAYRILKDERYKDVAKRAFDYIQDYFIDKEYGGVYWEVDYKGNPINKKKQTYLQGFALYGFTEYYRATGDKKALEFSKEFFYLIEKTKDNVLGGYMEAFTEDWQPIDDVRLSDKDANEKKTMNTHLHILEPYTNLCRIWNNDTLKNAQRDLIDIFLNKILNKDNYHLNLFFDEQWNIKSNAVSYGHDIEASWLLYEAADVLGDSRLLNTVTSLSLKIVDAATEGVQADGSLIYEKDLNHTDGERHWWVQAESVVGYMYAYKNSGNISYKTKAADVWNYILLQIVDKENGEWYWSRYADGSINRKGDKAGFWKCPYHNSRMCLEMIEHFDLKL